MWSRVMEWVERAGAWVLLAVAVVFASDVTARYVFGLTAAFFPDLEWYGVCLAVSLGLAPALYSDAHVRVEVLSDRMRPAWRWVVMAIGHATLLLPWCAFVIFAGSRYAFNATLIGEGSADPGGLPVRWLPKWWLVVGFALLAGEGARQLFSRKRPPNPAV